MPKIILIFFAFIFTSCQAQADREHPGDTGNRAAAWTQATPVEFPRQLGYVNDYVQILSGSQRDHLEAKLRFFDSATTNQIAIIIIDAATLTEENFDVYSLKLSNYWGISANGLSIVLSPKLRKIRINTGTGIEHILTDPICAKVIRTIIVPEFKQANYFEGLDRATDELIWLWQQ